MTLPLREYLPAYAFLLGGPVTAGVVYIAGKAFEKNLDQLVRVVVNKGTLEDLKQILMAGLRKPEINSLSPLALE